MVIETKQAFLRNLSTSWLEGGKKSGPLIIFLHGYPDGPEIWSKQIEHFTQEYHVICPYVRGTFASEPGTDPNRFSTHSLSLDILEIIKIVDPKGQKEIRVVGHDLGGAVAWRLATYLGPRLSRLVVINSLSIEQMGKRLLNRPKQWINSWYIFPFLIPGLSEKVVGTFSSRLLPWAYRLGGLKPEQFPKMKLKEPFPVSTLKLYRAFAREALNQEKSKPIKIKAPTLVIWGRKDPFLLPPTTQEIEPYTQQLTIRILDGGHWIFRENSELTNELIQNFFNQGVKNAIHS